MKQENPVFPYTSAHCQPRSGSRPSSAVLFTSHISQMAFLTAPQLNSFLGHPLPQETALILLWGISETFHLHKSSSHQQLQAIAHVQNEEWWNTRVQSDSRWWHKGKARKSAHARIFQENNLFVSQSPYLKNKARSNTFHSSALLFSYLYITKHAQKWLLSL